MGLAMLMAIPCAVLVAVYMAEYAHPRVSKLLRVVLDVLNDVPAIVVGCSSSVSSSSVAARTRSSGRPRWPSCVTIFVFSESADPGEQAAAWAAALVLIAFVLVLNMLAKLFARGRPGR